MMGAHEIYHLRQGKQDHAYMKRSLEANFRYFNFKDHDAYDFDQGEMAATAFELRYLIERSRRTGDKGPVEDLLENSMSNAYKTHLYSLIYRAERKKHQREPKKMDMKNIVSKWQKAINLTGMAGQVTSDTLTSLVFPDILTNELDQLDTVMIIESNFYKKKYNLGAS